MESGKADRLFRAAVSAFCALTRPSRREIAQLEDLTLPLFDSVSVETRRYVAAILSEIDHAPAGLVRRLSEEPISIAAPLLIRSKLLTDVDLIRLIARHGMSHARAILRRPNLNPTIANLVRAMERPAVAPADSGGPDLPQRAEGKEGKDNAEIVRQKLRAMMSPQDTSGRGRPLPLDRATMYRKLRSTALTGRLTNFQRAFADTLGIDSRKARSIVEAAGYDELILAFRALGLEAEQAFLLIAAIRPGCFLKVDDIRQFLDNFQLCLPETARETLESWQNTGSPVLKAS